MWCIYNEILPTIKKEILPFSTTQMDLEGIILSEISQKEKRQIHLRSHLWVECKNIKLIKTDSRMVVVRAWRVGVMGDVSVKVQTFSFKF